MIPKQNPNLDKVGLSRNKQSDENKHFSTLIRSVIGLFSIFFDYYFDNPIIANIIRCKYAYVIDNFTCVMHGNFRNVFEFRDHSSHVIA